MRASAAPKAWRTERIAATGPLPAHSVQFYERDEFLVATVGEHLAEGLRADQAVIVIAAIPHREEIAAALLARGFDVHALRARGQYVAVDAAATLDEFLVEAWPDRDRFRRTIGGLVDTARRQFAGVRVFSEMVAVLCERGQMGVALRSEELWNELGLTCEFSLLCGYPLNAFGSGDDHTGFQRVCVQHAHVLPAESYTPLADTNHRLRAITDLQQRAQALRAETAKRRAAEQSLEQREAELADFFENASVGLQRIGPDRRILWANKAQVALLGETSQDYLDRDFAEFLTRPESLDEVWQRVLSGGAINDWPCELRYRDGSTRHALLQANGLWDGAGLVHVRCVLHDITERHLAADRLRESEERYRRLIELAPTAVIVYRDGRIVLANRATCELLGASDVSQLIDRSPFDVLHPDEHASVCERIAKMSACSEAMPFVERRMLRVDGTIVHVETAAVPFDDQGQRAIHVVVRDITARRENEARVRYLAEHDPLTQLPNRVVFFERLAAALDDARRRKSTAAVLYVDLDRIKLVNDALGHVAGDRLLKAAAARLKECMHESCVVARFGGDEFTVLLPCVSSLAAVRQAAALAVAAFSRSFSVGGREIFMTPSIGAAAFPDDGLDAETLLKHADLAMYKVKKRGGNGVEFFSADLEEALQERLDLESRLHAALRHDEFRLHYQPVFDLATGRIESLEGLLRWQPPGEGMISPARFIPVAEETGLIVPIGEWVIRTAAVELRGWHDLGWKELNVAVNVSARQLREPMLEGSLRRALRAAGLPARHLTLELTESIFLEHASSTRALLQSLKALGLRLSLDDFGTGYSSLGYLKRFPIDQLKIDRSFVSDITTDQDDAAIVSAVLAMAEALGLPVVAEGVETHEQLVFLRARGCAKVQGFLLGRPMPPEEVAAMLAAQGS